MTFLAAGFWLQTVPMALSSQLTFDSKPAAQKGSKQLLFLSKRSGRRDHVREPAWSLGVEWPAAMHAELTVAHFRNSHSENRLAAT
jgi:hypothetical protein